MSSRCAAPAVPAAGREQLAQSSCPSGGHQTHSQTAAVAEGFTLRRRGGGGIRRDRARAMRERAACEGRRRRAQQQPRHIAQNAHRARPGAGNAQSAYRGAAETETAARSQGARRHGMLWRGRKSPAAQEQGTSMARGFQEIQRIAAGQPAGGRRRGTAIADTKGPSRGAGRANPRPGPTTTPVVRLGRLTGASPVGGAAAEAPRAARLVPLSAYRTARLPRGPPYDPPVLAPVPRVLPNPTPPHTHTPPRRPDAGVPWPPAL